MCTCCIGRVIYDLRVYIEVVPSTFISQKPHDEMLNTAVHAILSRAQTTVVRRVMVFGVVLSGLNCPFYMRRVDVFSFTN